jgi:hypothetical protein
MRLSQALYSFSFSEARCAGVAALHHRTGVPGTDVVCRPDAHPTTVKDYRTEDWAPAGSGTTPRKAILVAFARRLRVERGGFSASTISSSPVSSETDDETKLDARLASPERRSGFAS